MQGVDKQAIVLDIGSRYLKCGLSEERAPRSVIRWEIAELQQRRSSVIEWRNYLAPQLRQVCFTILRVNPRHRRVVICEDLVGMRDFRYALVDVIFNTLKAASITLIPSAVVALYATSHHTALVVDCGWSETRILPVYKGIPLPYLTTSVRVGMKTCCQELCKAGIESSNTEDVVERACFVQSLKNPSMDIVNAVFNDSLTIPSRLRWEVCQHLFDDKEQSIVSCITALFQKFPLDIRAPMLENMIVIGGGAMLPGFRTRLVEQLQEALSYDYAHCINRIHIVPLHFPSNLLVWIGGSIYAATEASREHLITANQYHLNGIQCLPEWMSIEDVEIEIMEM